MSRIALVIAMILTLGTQTGTAATHTVSTLADSGTGSLRTKIAAAAPGDTVNISVTGTITLASEIKIASKDLAIQGGGADQVTITTSGSTRALNVSNSACTISGISFANCSSLTGTIEAGGAIAVDNFTTGGTNKTTTIIACAFLNNRAGWGGALDVFQGGLVLDQCTFANNSCTGLAIGTDGGGGAVSVGPTLSSTIRNCTFSGNIQSGTSAARGGGAIYNFGTGVANPARLTIEHCTFVENNDAAGTAGAIVGNYTASYHTIANLRNSLFVNNQAPAVTLKNFARTGSGALNSAFLSLGGNVSDEANTSPSVMLPVGDRYGDSLLPVTVLALANNGGPVKTHAIQRGSSAQRAGVATPTAVDQRGAPRHPVPDAGAFERIEPELQVSVGPAILVDNDITSFGSTPFNTAVTRSITIKNTQTSSFASGPLSLGNLILPTGYSASGFPLGALANGQTASFNVVLTGANAGLFEGGMTFTANDTFQPSLAANQAGNANLHQFILSGLVTDTIDHWRQQNFGTGATNSGSAADSATPAGDGVSNLMKYALGLDPRIPASLTENVRIDLTPEGALRATVSKNPAATDVIFAVKVSNSPTNGWTSAGTVLDQNSMRTLQVHDSATSEGVSSRFMRLDVFRR